MKTHSNLPNSGIFTVSPTLWLREVFSPGRECGRSSRCYCWKSDRNQWFLCFMDKLIWLSGWVFSGSTQPTVRSPHMPGYFTTRSAVAKSHRTCAQPYRPGSRPLKLSQRVPRADLMPEFVHTNIARHAYRRCTLPFYLCQPVTFSWPLLRADTGVVRWCPHTPTELHTHTHTYSEPAFKNSLHLSLPLVLLAPGSKKKKKKMFDFI